MSSLKSNIEYIGEWEALYNPKFNYTVSVQLEEHKRLKRD